LDRLAQTREAGHDPTLKILLQIQQDPPYLCPAVHYPVGLQPDIFYLTIPPLSGGVEPCADSLAASRQGGGQHTWLVFIFHTFKTLVEMLSTTEKKINNAMRRLMEIEGGIITLAALLNYERDDNSNLHIEAARANTVEAFVRRIGRQTKRTYEMLDQALHPDSESAQG